MPLKFGRLLPDHEVSHCGKIGWERLANGKLMSAAEEAGFPVMVTVDRNMQFQQNMTGRKLAVLYLRVPGNDLDTLRPMAQLVSTELDRLQPGIILTLNHPDMR